MTLDNIVFTKRDTNIQEGRNQQEGLTNMYLPNVSNLPNVIYAMLEKDTTYLRTSACKYNTQCIGLEP